MQQRHQHQMQLANQMTYKMLQPVKSLILDQIKQNAVQQLDPINSIPTQSYANQGGVISTQFNKQQMASQNQEQVVLQYDKQKETQLLNITSNQSTVDIAINGLSKNFSNMSASFSYQGNDCNYYVNRLIVPNTLPNTSRSMDIQLKADLIMLDQVTGEFITFPCRKDQQIIQNSFDIDQTDNGSVPIQIFLVPSNIGTIDQQRKHWSQINEDIRTDLLSSSDLQDNINEGINRFLTEMDYNLKYGNSSIQDYPQNHQNLYQLFHSTSFIFDQQSGKFGFKTRNCQQVKNVEIMTKDNYYYEKERLVLVNYQIQIYSTDMRTSNSIVLGRMFGFDMTIDEYVGTVINSQTSLFPMAYKIADATNTGYFGDNNIESVIQKFPFPSNMFPTDYVRLQTSLNTNSWDCNGKGKTNVLLEYNVSQSPLEAPIPWEQSNQLALHQETLDGLRNFQLFLTDQYNEPIIFLQGRFHIQICVEMKQRQNNQFKQINSI